MTGPKQSNVQYSQLQYTDDHDRQHSSETDALQLKERHNAVLNGQKSNIHRLTGAKHLTAFYSRERRLIDHDHELQHSSKETDVLQLEEGHHAVLNGQKSNNHRLTGAKHVTAFCNREQRLNDHDLQDSLNNSIVHDELDLDLYNVYKPSSERIVHRSYSAHLNANRNASVYRQNQLASPSSSLPSLYRLEKSAASHSPQYAYKL